MRLLATVVCAAAVCTTASTCYAAETAFQSDAFVNSIGVNTHLGFNQSQYAYDWSQTFAALKKLGVRHIRDIYFDYSPSYPLYGRHRALAAAGIKCEYIIPYNTAGVEQNIRHFAGLVQDMEAVEAPNEFDDGNGYRNNWEGRLRGFLPTVLKAGHAANVPALGPSLVRFQSFEELGNVSRDMDYNNLHVYFAGRNPENLGWGSSSQHGHKYSSFGFWNDAGQIDGPGVPQMITEFGYLTHPAINGPGTIPDDVAAAYLTRGLLTAFAHGFRRTYIFQLIDEPIRAKGFGLLNEDMSPKASFTAISNLTALLSDPGSGFRTGSLSYSLTGDTDGVNHVLLQKRDGSFWLALWVGKQTYDPGAERNINVPPQTVHLDLSGSESAKGIHRLQDNGSMTYASLGGSRSMSLQVGSTVSVVEIR